jgi:hypothetical protein
MRLGVSLILLLFMGIPFSGCKTENSELIEEKRFISIYADILYLSGDQYQEEDEVLQREYMDSLLTANDMTMEDFERTLRYYNQDAFRWKNFIEKVIRELETRRDQDSDSS